MKPFITLCSLCFALYSCSYTTGSGRIVNEKRSATNFTGINASNNIDVEIRIGQEVNIAVEADDNIIKHIITSVNDGVLDIRITNLHNFNTSHTKVYVTMPVLKSIAAQASASVKVVDVIKYDGKLNFTATSSADIDAQVDAPEIYAEANSSGSINLKGRTKNYTAEVSSSADINSFNLLSENTTVSANSSGSADVFASVNLTADASSSGDITYDGAAAVKKSVSSSGSVEKKD